MNQKYLEFIENLAEGIWIIDKDAKTSYVNSNMAEMLGYTQDEMKEKYLFYFMDTLTVETAKKYLQRGAKEITENQTFEFIHKTGEKVFTKINTCPLLDSYGKYNGSIAAITNITERKKLEEITKQLEVKFKAIFDYASIGLAILNTELQIIDANKKMCEKLQYSKAELLNINLAEIVSPEYKHELQGNIDNLIKGTSSAFIAEYKFIRKDSSIGWGITNFLIVKEDPSQDLQIIFTLRDVTEQKNLEQEIFRHEALFKGVLEHSTAAITIWDRELRNIYANPIAFDQVGRKRETVPPRRHLREGLPNLPGFYEKWEKRLLHCFNTQCTHQYSDVDQMGAKFISSESITIPIFESDGNVFAVAIIFQDISERKKLEQEFLKTEKFTSLGKLAAHLSHEIRSPLASIAMNLDYLSKNIKLNQKLLKSFTLINGEIERLSNLLEEILGFSREYSLHKLDFNIKDTLDNIFELFKSNFKGKNINFVNRVDSQLIHADADKIKAVLIDVIKNSLEAIDKEGTIEIYSHINADYNIFELFIKDSGCGVDDITKLFDPFYTTKTRGTGLGLPIAKIIIEKHGGTINLVSSKPGETIFQINLPINEKVN